MTPRILLAALLIASVSARAMRPITPEHMDPTAVAALLAPAGFHYRETRTVPVSGIEILLFDGAGCTAPLGVVPLLATGEEAALVGALIPPGETRLFVYDDVRSTRFDWRRFAVARVKLSLLATFGLGRDRPLEQALMIVTPPGCATADRLDWASLWHRR